MPSTANPQASVVYEGFKKLKNLRNKYFNLYKASNDDSHKEKYIHYMKDFNVLDKFLYKQYISRFEDELKVNPKAFWKYIRSKKGCSNIPSCMSYCGRNSESVFDSVNLFADFFKSNYVSDAELSGCNVVDIPQSVDFGSLSVTKQDVIDGISALQLSLKCDLDGLSSYVLKNAVRHFAYP